MKLNKFAFTLTAIVLLPTLAYASTDEIVASFERDLQRDTAVASLAIANAEVDPLDIINNILNKEQDAVVVSFERDLYRVPAASSVTITRESDPLVDALNVALYGTA